VLAEERGLMYTIYIAWLVSAIRAGGIFIKISVDKR
jgi:hypothetical protein